SFGSRLNGSGLDLGLNGAEPAVGRVGGDEHLIPRHVVAQVERHLGPVLGQHQDGVPEDGFGEVGAVAGRGGGVAVGVLADDERRGLFAEFLQKVGGGEIIDLGVRPAAGAAGGGVGAGCLARPSSIGCGRPRSRPARPGSAGWFPASPLSLYSPSGGAGAAAGTFCAGRPWAPKKIAPFRTSLAGSAVPVAS